MESPRLYVFAAALMLQILLLFTGTQRNLHLNSQGIAEVQRNYFSIFLNALSFNIFELGIHISLGLVDTAIFPLLAVTVDCPILSFMEYAKFGSRFARNFSIHIYKFTYFMLSLKLGNYFNCPSRF